MIDSQILRVVIESIFRSQNGGPPADDPGKFERLALSIVNNQGLSQDISKQWMDFLCRRRAPNNFGLFEFSKISPEARENSHYAILARATLLLRVASGSSADLFQAAGFTSDNIAFWWQAMGQSRGLWEGAKSADDLLDLWADIDLLLGDLDIFQKKHTQDAQTFFRVGSELGQAIVGLGSCERVAIWSLTPS
jgi:hypothetical protein